MTKIPKSEAAIIPPKTGVPTARRVIAPAPLAMTRGSSPRIKAKLVIITGRNLRRHGKPSTPADLTSHACIVHDIGPDPDIWTFVTPEGTQGLRVSGRFIANDGRAVHGAARVGYGIAFLSPLEVLDDLRSGELVRVLNDFQSPGLPLNLVYSSRRHLAPRTRLVLDFIREDVRKILAVLAAAPEEPRGI
jgi:DNA-binding transcriptional LysR family regulator